VAFQITKNVTFLSTNPNDAAIEENILDVFNQFKRRAQDVLYNVITRKSQAYARENMMNSAFEFLQHLRNCVNGFEVINRNTDSSPSESRRNRLLQTINQKIPNDPLKDEFIRRLNEIEEAFEYDETNED
jgi:lipopolysaccharide biosynthesis regulator YciM